MNDENLKGNSKVIKSIDKDVNFQFTVAIYE